MVKQGRRQGCVGLWQQVRLLRQLRRKLQAFRARHPAPVVQREHHRHTFGVVHRLRAQERFHAEDRREDGRAGADAAEAVSPGGVDQKRLDSHFIFVIYQNIFSFRHWMFCSSFIVFFPITINRN